MRVHILLPLCIAGATFLTTLQGGAQDRPLRRLFSGEKSTESGKRNPSRDTGKKLQRAFSGPKSVEVNLTTQTLRAYEGNRVVLKTNISSGRNRATPTGRYSAGYKDPDHYSSLYHSAPMPWSVQVSGNIFIHGSSSVPNYPASHGCIRVPLTGRNAAKRFFQWVDPGTPIRIAY
jgi:lipoprotein-anchoring transpeptidase ErfK/SrfK